MISGNKLHDHPNYYNDNISDYHQLHQILSLYETNKKSLSVRLQNILTDLETLHEYDKSLKWKFKYLNYLLSINQDFSKNRSVGRKTALEFSKFKALIIKPFKTTKSSEISSDFNLEQLLAHYKLIKPTISVRLRHILQVVEHEYGWDETAESRMKFIHQLLIENIDLSYIRNYGKKTEVELRHFKNTIFSNYQDDLNHKVSHTSRLIIRDINANCGLNLNLDNWDTFFSDNEYSISKLFFVALLRSSFVKSNHIDVIRRMYFDIDSSDRSIVMSYTNLTSERVRQLIKKYNQDFLWKMYSAILNSIPFKPHDEIDTSGRSFIVISKSPSFKFEDEVIEPNFRVSKSLNSLMLGGEFVCFNSQLETALPIPKSLNLVDKHILISKKFIQDTKLFEMLSWADEQIHSFELINFEFKLDILVKRFYSEQNISVNNEDIAQVVELIELIKGTSIQIESTLSKRAISKEKKKKIIDDIRWLLEQSNTALKTAEIVDHLEENNHEINLQNLLVLLNKNKSFFLPFGTGYWGLKEWEDDEASSGSIKQIIFNKLSVEDRPLHISELIGLLSTRRPVNANSILSNLKLDEYNLFRFFNCSYIGIQSKEYHESWSKLPSFKPTILRSLRKITDQEILNKEIVKVSEEKNIPIVHLNYLLGIK